MSAARRIPKEDRDDMARLALSISKACTSQEEAKRAVSEMFSVSSTTAMRLILRGRHLSIQSNAEACL